MRNCFVVTWMFSLLLTGAVNCFAASDMVPGGVTALADLLRSKGMITAEEYAMFRAKSASGAASRTDLKLLVDLLRTKGSLSKEEAAVFLESLTVRPIKYAEPGELVPAESVAENTKAQPLETVAEKPRPLPEMTEAEKAAIPVLADDELKMSLQLLREQGVLGNDETAQIGQRIGRKWSAADEDELVAGSDLDIEYNRTTLPRDVLLAKLAPLQAQGVINRDEVERIRARFQQKLALEKVTDDIGSNLRREVDKQVAEKILPVPDWVRRIKLSGDMRLRYEGDYFDNRNAIFLDPKAPSFLLNSNIDRNRLLVRARLAATAKINDKWQVAIGLATGNTTNPVSTNTTLGDSLNKKNFQMDLAYLKWTPTKSLTMWGGRFPNPWFSSDLVWDNDVNFDGVAISYKPKLTSTTSLFMTAGAFPIQEVELSARDKWLFGGQVGVQYRNEKKLTAKLAAAFYDFEHVTGVANDPTLPNQNDWTAPGYQQKGNTLFDIDPSTSIKTAYASEFRELNLTGSLDFGFWDPLRVVLLADYVKNIGFKKSEVDALTGANVKKENEGYQFGITLGYPQTVKAGQWKASLFYKYLESDAVIDAFTDSDFHLGGTNAKGWILGGDLGIARNVWLATRWYTANEISGPPLTIDVFQLNLNARF